MAVIANPAIVLEDGAGVDDAILAHTDAGVQNGTSHHDRARPDRRRWVQYGGWMRGSHHGSKAHLRPQEPLRPSLIGADRDGQLRIDRRTEGIILAEDRTIAKSLSDFGGVVIDKADLPIAASSTSEVEYDLAVATSTPNHESAHWETIRPSLPRNSAAVA